jgi:hypothetical protein
MKRGLSIGILLSLFFVLSIQAKVVKFTKNYNDFTAVSLNCGGSLHLKQGNEYSVIVKCDDSLLPELNIYVDNGTLFIGRKDKIFSFFSSLLKASFNPSNLDIYVTMKNIKQISASATGKIYVDGNINVEGLSLNSSSASKLMIEKIVAKTDVSIKSSSAGDVKISKLNTQSLYGESSSSGGIEISNGCVDNLNISASSGGDCDLDGLKVIQGDVSASSAGEIAVNITGNASLRASSGSSIHVYGKPKVENLSVSSGANVII